MLHFIIGDIHGCIDELLALEKKVLAFATRRKQDALIVSCGDLVDRGPNSRAVIEHFLQGEKAGTHRAVLGNHEAMFLHFLEQRHATWFKKQRFRRNKYLRTPQELYQGSRWARGFSKQEFAYMNGGFWLAQGGNETLRSYGVNPRSRNMRRLPKDHIRYLCRLPMFFEARGLIVTHALPKAADYKLLKKYESGEAKMSLETKRACERLFWNRERSQLLKPGKKRLISGHTPFEKPKRLSGGRLLQIDTHCYVGGALTAYCPELNRFFSVKAKKKYYKE